jgi:hypothetical protein
MSCHYCIWNGEEICHAIAVSGMEEKYVMLLLYLEWRRNTEEM